MSKKDRQHKFNKAEKSASKPEPERSNAMIWVAVIGGMVSIVLAVLGFPPLINYLNTKWNSIPTLIPTPALSPIPSESPTIENLPNLIFTETLTPFLTETPSSVASPNETGVMKAQIVYFYGTGKAPLQGTFKADSSFVSYSDGTSLDCAFKNVCSFTWDVRLDGKTVYGPIAGESAFSYTFQKRGNYMVVVYVCRGGVCNFSAVNIMVN